MKIQINDGSLVVQRGYQVCRASLQKDGHLMGDNWMQYIRTRKNAPKSAPQVMIYDPDWQVRNSADDFNNGQPVRFAIA